MLNEPGLGLGNVLPPGGGGGFSKYTRRGDPTYLHIANPNFYTSLKFYTPKNTWHQNFQPPKIQDLNNANLIYSMKQKKVGMYIFLIH